MCLLGPIQTRGRNKGRRHARPVDRLAGSADRAHSDAPGESAMKVGTALNMLCQPGRSDAFVVGEHLALGDLAEPLGFDSLFALEHHFTGYAMSPAPAQLLSYFAGRTRRISLGTAVIVLPWHDPVRVAEDIHRYREIAAGAGHMPRPPIILTNVSVAESRDEAEARAFTYLGRKWESIDTHYHFSDGHLATVKGYESYGKMAKTYAKMKDESFRDKAMDFYVSIQIVGTPKDCLDKIAELQRLTGMDHLVTEFSFGGLPHEEAELNMRLFADKILPVLQH